MDEALRQKLLQVALWHGVPNAVPLRQAFGFVESSTQHIPDHQLPTEIPVIGVRFIRVRTGGVRAFRVRYEDCCPWHPVELWSRWR